MTHSQIYNDLLRAEQDALAFIDMHPELELCQHNQNALMGELVRLNDVPTIADLERVYNELTAQGRLILRYRKEEN